MTVNGKTKVIALLADYGSDAFLTLLVRRIQRRAGALGYGVVEAILGCIAEYSAVGRRSPGRLVFPPQLVVRSSTSKFKPA